jgi:kynurenine formamidase
MSSPPSTTRSTSVSYGALAWPRLTPDLLALVRTGTVYSLGHVLEAGIPLWSGHPPLQILAFLRHGETDYLEPPATVATELVSMGMHTGTHIDALCHIGRREEGGVRLYGDVPGNSQDHRGFKQLGIEHMPPILARLVLLDVAGLRGVDLVPDCEPIGADELRRCAEAQGTPLSPGCAVAVRTGWERLWMRENARFGGRHPGIDVSAARLLADAGCAVVGADTPTVEVLPAPDHAVHQVLLVDAGVPLVENLRLDELAADGCHESLLVVLPLKLRGATASVVHPIAIA